MTRPQIIKDAWPDFSWDDEKIWRLDEPVTTISIDQLLWHFDIPFWESEGTDDFNLTIWETIRNPEIEISHSERINQADLCFPINIMADKGRYVILDGLHRLAKAYILGKKEIDVRIIPKSRIPEIITG